VVKKKTKRKVAPKKKATTKAKKKAAAPKKKIAKKKATSQAPSEASIERALTKGPRSNKELRTELGVEDKTLTRTLQRLRRRGVLKVIKNRWVLSTVQICPTCEGRGWVNESPIRRKKKAK